MVILSHVFQQINNIVTYVNLDGNDMQDRGARYVAEALLENIFVEELVRNRYTQLSNRIVITAINVMVPACHCA